jgi:AcrR family transcriptional regulator
MTDDATQLERFPRRTLRRQQTRAAILKAANRLFRKVGYGAATMTAIADGADVHVTTLFTHFKTKRDLAVSLNDASVALLERLAADAKGNTPFFDFFRALVLKSAERIEPTSGDPALSLWHELREDPELTFAWVQYEQRQIVLLSDYIAHDYGLDQATDYRPELVANLLIASSWTSHRHWTENAQTLDLKTETNKALEIAIQMAKAVLGG